MRVLLLIFAFTFLLLPQHSFATHIVGGEMNYTCLGDDQYEIRLTIYRDCFYGNPNAYFDDPASIGVFDQNHQLLQEILVPLIGDDTLSPVLFDECLVVPTDVCVHTTTYRTIVELPPLIGGYQLAYQRCCRNQTIANIVNPLATGATYGVTISERALLECNSSATFLQWPPLYICANVPISFDQSATDVDGDSIVYKLCTPLQGADPDNPIPQPPNNPPYDEIIWQAPTYGLDNMLNGLPGGVPLQINAQTGLLTGVPNTVGQFVVGICVEEYRDGELISTTRRDFQYNVDVCGETTAAFFAPDIQCDNLIVNFDNQTDGTENYLWQFGDPANPTAFSEEENPIYVYPEEGVYEITLIAAPGEICADTFTQAITLLDGSLFANFEIDTLSCGDSLAILTNNLSFDTESNIIGWEWEINEEFYSDEEAPAIVFLEEGIYEINLTAFAENGCEASFLTSIELALIEDTFPADTLFLCPGEGRALNAEFDPDLEYLWTPATFLNNPTSPNPISFPATSISYQLLITDPESGCQAERNIHLEVVPPVNVNAGEDIVTCEEFIQLTATSETAVRFFWSTDPDFATIDAEGATYTVNPIGEVVYYVLVADQAGCLAQDTIVVNSQAVNIDALPQDTFVCPGFPANFFFENTDPNDVLDINWSPDPIILSGDGTNAIVAQATVAGLQPIWYAATNQFGCAKQDTFFLTTLDTMNLQASIDVAQCSGNTIHFSSESANAPIYQWWPGDPIAPDTMKFGASVDYTYSAPGTYEVMVTLPSFVPCPDTLIFMIEVEEMPPLELGLSWAYETCTDEAEIVFTNTSNSITSVINQVEWWISDTLNFIGEQATITIENSSLIEVQLITTSANGCVDTLTELVDIPLIDLALADSLQICPGTSVGLYPGANEDFNYQWSPATVLDDSSAPNPIATPLTGLTFGVTVTDPNSICEEEGQVVVTVPPAMEYTVSSSEEICDPTWQLWVADDEDLNVIWALDQGFTQVVSTDSAFVADVTESSTFYVQVSDQFGCQNVEEIVLTQQGFELILTPAATICVNDSVQLVANSSGAASATNFEWSPASAIIGATNTPAILVSPPVSTTYILSASNDAGCVIDTSIELSIFNFVPPLVIVPTVDTILLGESTILEATASENYTYSWSPSGTLDNDSVFDPEASPDTTTLYQLHIEDANGCSNNAEALVVVLELFCREPYIFVPNAFSPNGDLLNDVLKVEGEVIEEMHLSIYDRWGELVFESFDKEIGWDGSFKNKPLSPDVYGYILEMRCIGGAEYFKKGNISLLR